MIDFKQVKANNINDVKNLAELSTHIWHEFWTCIITKEQIDYMIDKFQSEKAITSQIKNENFVYFFITSSEEIIGYVGLCKKEDFLLLSKLYLKKGYRHKGIGTKAFNFIKEYAFTNNYKVIHLSINRYNQATIDAFNKWGFEKIGAVVTDIGQGFVMDDYVMEYTF